MEIEKSDFSQKSDFLLFMRLIKSLALMALLLAGCSAPRLRGGVFSPPAQAADFALPNVANGEKVVLSSLRGNAVMIYFGYTTCPDICPMTLSTLARAKKMLGSDADKMKVIFVSVDPDRDTPDKLRDYVRAFDQNFIALRGSEDDLLPILTDYQVVVKKTPQPGSAIGYSIDHTAFVFVVDPAGKLREVISTNATADDVANDVRVLLR